jgi:hypothetical protein
MVRGPVRTLRNLSGWFLQPRAEHPTPATR